MTAFRTVTGIAAPLPMDDLDTDQIAPIPRVNALRPDYARMLFSRMRWRADGTEEPDFPLNRPAWRDARILVTGRNFGCGSSRDDAVLALAGFGIRCVIARSFADTFRENSLRNGLLPVTLPPEQSERIEALVASPADACALTVDLETRTIRGPGGFAVSFEIAEAERTALLEGLDDIGLTLMHEADIASWEQRAQADLPWLQSLIDRRSQRR